MIKDRGVNILRIGKDRLLYKQTVIMIGHLMHTDLSDTVDRIDCTEFAEVTALDLAMPAINEPSSARLIIKSVSKKDMDSALDILRDVARTKKLLIIEPLEGETRMTTRIAVLWTWLSGLVITSANTCQKRSGYYRDRGGRFEKAG